jgi:hypothetical protein
LIVDFWAGSYGNFLSYVLNRFVFNVPNSDFNPFTSFGTSHLGKINSDYQDNKIVYASHYSFNAYLDLDNVDITTRELILSSKETHQLIDDTITLTSDTGVIRIVVDDFYPVFYNSLVRAGDTSIDVDNIEFNTLSKLEHFKFLTLKTTIIENLGKHIHYYRSDLRNIFYSSLYENVLGIDKYNKFLPIDNQIYHFNVGKIYDYISFIEELGKISMFVGKRGWDYKHNKLYPLWQEFIEKNQGHQSYKKCQRIIMHILAADDINFNCNILEEAYLNSFITKTFNIFDGMDCFDNQYPTNTKQLHDLIISKVKENRK